MCNKKIEKVLENDSIRIQFPLLRIKSEKPSLWFLAILWLPPVFLFPFSSILLIEKHTFHTWNRISYTRSLWRRTRKVFNPLFQLFPNVRVNDSLNYSFLLPFNSIYKTFPDLNTEYVGMGEGMEERGEDSNGFLLIQQTKKLMAYWLAWFRTGWLGLGKNTD